MAMMTSPLAMACSRPVPAMTMATGEASTMRAAVAKALMRPTIRTPMEKSPMTAAVSFSAASLAREVNSAVAKDTAMSEWGSMNTREAFVYAAFEAFPPPGTEAPDATLEMTRNPSWPMSMAANVQNAT